MCANSGTKPVHYDVHTVTKAGEKAMKDSDDQKKNKYKRTYRLLEKYASSKLRDNNVAYPELNEIYVKTRQVYHGEPKVIMLGINIDGSINNAFKDLLMKYAERKHPKTLKTKSYIIRRSQFKRKHQLPIQILQCPVIDQRSPCLSAIA